MTQEEARAVVQGTQSPQKARKGVCRHFCP
nr:MAG TPA: hypothetical protein [Caudoviricetes sp.]